jgi:hypothetical protein
VVLPTPPFVETTAKVITLLFSPASQKRREESRLRRTWQLGVFWAAACATSPFHEARLEPVEGDLTRNLFFYAIEL